MDKVPQHLFLHIPNDCQLLHNKLTAKLSYLMSGLGRVNKANLLLEFWLSAPGSSRNRGAMVSFHADSQDKSRQRSQTTVYSRERGSYRSVHSVSTCLSHLELKVFHAAHREVKNEL